MDNNDLLKLLERINKEELPFMDRLPASLKFVVIEQIATNYFRNHDLINAEKYFDLLPDNIFENGIGGEPYYYNNKYQNDYSNFTINTSDTERESLKKYNKKTAIKTILEITNEIDQKNNIDFKKDSLLSIRIRKEISNLYFDLSCMYSTPFWAYSRIWQGVLLYGFHYTQYEPFNNLNSKFVKIKMDTFLNKYGNQKTSIKYLNKAIEFSDEKERLAKLNFKLLKKLKEPFQTSFHKRCYNSVKWESIVKDYEAKTISTALLIDSLYQNTNYFKEVISECTDFKNKNPKHNKKPVIEAKEEIKIENDENIYKLLITIIILILIIIIGVFYFKKAS